MYVVTYVVMYVVMYVLYTLLRTLLCTILSYNMGAVNSSVDIKSCFEYCFRFGNALRSGLLEVVVPPKDFYPDLDNLPKDITFHDPPSRVK